MNGQRRVLVHKRKRSNASLGRRVLLCALFLSPLSLLLLCSSPAADTRLKSAPGAAIFGQGGQAGVDKQFADAHQASRQNAQHPRSATAKPAAGGKEQSTVKNIVERLKRDEFHALANALARRTPKEREVMVAGAVKEARRIFDQLHKIPAPVSSALIKSAPARNYIQSMMDKFNSLSPDERQALAPLMKEIVSQLESF